MGDAVEQAVSTAGPAADPAASMVTPALPTPSIRRRIGSLLYEALLLLALLLIAAFPAAGMKGATLEGWPRILFQLYLAVVVAAYFSWFWRHSGQTLPMKTWHIRLLAWDGQPLTPAACVRRLFFLALLYGPACAGMVVIFFPQRVNPALSIFLFVPMLAAWLWARYDPERQFLHDRLAGTRQVDIRTTDKR